MFPKHRAVKCRYWGNKWKGCQEGPTFCSAADLVITTLNQVCLQSPGAGLALPD